MADPTYDRLSFLDSTFLALEAPTSHMHVAAICTFDAAGVRNAAGGIDVERIRQYVASRLHRIPRYRQVIRFAPLDNHPVWVDDHHFNIEYHVRHTALPKPGDDAQLKMLGGRIMSQQLDRAKPLWEMWIVEGLHGGSQFALISKVHHCMIDGISGVDLMAVLLSLEPLDTAEPALPWRPRPVPSSLELMRDEILRYATGPASLVRDASSTLRDVFDPTSEVRTRLSAVFDGLQGLSRLVPTPLNEEIGPHRRFDWTTMPVAEIKRVKNALGGSLNDVVLATVAGALRRFFARRDFDCSEIDFRVAAPVSMRTQDERGMLGNRVSGWLIPMPLIEEDPRLRLRRISEVTAGLKESNQALGADALIKAAEWTPSTLLSVAARVMKRALPFHLIVTNVPGPQFPLYLLGARMLDSFGQVPLFGSTGLGIALLSYDGRLCWGFNADWDVVPDVDRFRADIEASFAELSAAADDLVRQTAAAS